MRWVLFLLATFWKKFCLARWTLFFLAYFCRWLDNQWNSFTLEHLLQEILEHLLNSFPSNSGTSLTLSPLALLWQEISLHFGRIWWGRTQKIISPCYCPQFCIKKKPAHNFFLPLSRTLFIQLRYFIFEITCLCLLLLVSEAKVCNISN